MPERANRRTDLATVEVRLHHQGRAFKQTLQVSDSVSPTFIHSLLTEATSSVRDAYNDYQREQMAQRDRERVVESEQAADQADAAEEVAWRKDQATIDQLDAPPLPDPSPLPERGGQCRAVILKSWVDQQGSHVRRVSCGQQLERHDVTMDLVCPNLANHVGGTAHVKERDGIPDDTSRFATKPSIHGGDPDNPFD